MNRTICSFLIVVLLASTMTFGADESSTTSTTSITYEGELKYKSGLAEGTFDFEFRLYDQSLGGTLLGSLTREGIVVTSGAFAAELDFGFQAVIAECAGERWMETHVRGAEASSFTMLEPRQQLLAEGTQGAGCTVDGQLNVNDAALAILATSDDRAIIGRLGVISCPGAPYAVGACGGSVGNGLVAESDTIAVVARSDTGIGVLGTSNTRGIVGTLANASCPGTYAVGACGGSVGNGLVAASDTIAVAANSNSRAVVATLGGVSCTGTYAVGACGGSTGDGVVARSDTGIGVLGTSNTRGIVGTLANASCAGTYAVGGCDPGNNVGVLGVSSSGTAVLAKTTSGNIFVGQTSGTNQVRIDSSGRGFFNGGTQNSGADFAELLPTSENPADLGPGDVLAIDPDRPNTVRKSSSARSRLVVGVYSTNAALLAVGEHRDGDDLTGEVPVGIVGILPTKVTTEGGPIRVGDLLMTSSTPGHAMRITPVRIDGIEIYPTGAVLGKAMEFLEQGTGLINVLVTLH